jgi:hypothetical protein
VSALIGDAAQRAATEAFHGAAGTPAAVTCPSCSHQFVPGAAAVRMTEAATDTKAPYGDVEYADPGYQQDKKKRYPLDTVKRVKAAWSYINDADNAALYGKKQLQLVRSRIKAAAKKLGVAIADKATEARINGKLSYSDICDLVSAAIRAKIQAAAGDGGYYWAYIVDLSDTDVVYQAGDDDLWQCSYTVTAGEDGDQTVALGDPIEVARTYAPLLDAGGDFDPAGSIPEATEDALEGATEATRDRILGRVVESKGSDDAGGRVFRVRVIAFGDSKNGRRYTESVLKAAAPLYDGAKAYDHHRDDQELRSSTIAGLVGVYRNVEATQDGLEADLHLLPSAVHAAEALDASLAAQADGLPPLVGISHDVMALYRPVVAGGQRLQEATSIVKVNSADIVADPSAGGKATRMVAGGVETQTDPANAGESTKESTVDTADVLAALKTATPEQLAAVGLSKASNTKTTEAVIPAALTAEDGALAKTSFMAKMMIRSAVEDAGLPIAVVESVTAALPDRVTESDVATQIAGLKTALGVAERAGLAPQFGNVEVTKESVDRKREALDAFFAGDYSKGYKSFKEAFVDFTGHRQLAWGEDFNRTVLRESFGGAGGGYDSATRGTESMDSTSWNLVLGDSITRRMVAEYQQPTLQTWRKVVSSMPSINDFRTQRIERIGGYGTLPGVNQGAPYQPLTSPSNEEVTYAVTKRGGTEDVTLEMIANDDIRAIQRIPAKLGLAAAQTLYRFVWDFFANNAAVYDSTALFHALHNNTAATALSQSNLSAARRAMRKQTAYGDSSDVLSVVPRTLVVCSDLEEIAFQLATSAVAIPATPAGPTNTPNIHQGLEVITVDYWTSTTSWFLSADTMMTPTIEIGFYQGRQDPELFTQADPTVGSVFNSDKITYKIRHIYSGAALDFRGLYRGNS